MAAELILVAEVRFFLREYLAEGQLHEWTLQVETEGKLCSEFSLCEEAMLRALGFRGDTQLLSSRYGFRCGLVTVAVERMVPVRELRAPGRYLPLSNFR